METLLSSLCGCIGHQIRLYTQEKEIACSGFSVNAEAELADDKLRLGDISMCIDMKATRLDEQQRSGLLDYVTCCKIYKSLSANSPIRIVLTRPAAARPSRPDHSERSTLERDEQ
jgi:uncharacterized OsmC-like protein